MSLAHCDESLPNGKLDEVEQFMEKTKKIIFYSWQSDLPNKTNRGFIEQALKNAVKAIRDDDSVQIEPVFDRDTKDIPGSPDIAKTMFSSVYPRQ